MPDIEDSDGYFGVPFLRPSLVGREAEIAQLHQVLNEGDGKAAVARTKVILAVTSARASVTWKKNLSAVTVAFRLGTETLPEARCSW